jgi:hypothetical protein
MSRWGYTPIENIAFALQNIAKILERIENKMPVPEGNITTSEILIPVSQVEADNVDAEEAVKEYDGYVAAYEAAIAEASEKAKNDLPELS